MPADKTRIDWVDYAKGICIILVVMFHAVGHVEWHFDAEGWLRPLVDFARPFRIPDFFLISGLFLSQTINSPLKTYVDRKIVHFIYFYLLWLTIQTPILQLELLASDPAGFAKLWIKSLIEPSNSLWFVHMLAIFYAVTRLLRQLPPWLLVLGAFALQSLFQLGILHTGWDVIDRFANRYVYFCIGFAFAPAIFSMAERAVQRSIVIYPLLIVWAGVNALAVANNLHNMFVTSFVLGMLGATAVCFISALLARHGLGNFIRYCGQNSIVIYLTYALPLAAAMLLLEHFGLPFGSVGLGSLLALCAAVGVPLLFHLAIRSTPLLMLYKRPAWASIIQRPSKAGAPISAVKT